MAGGVTGDGPGLREVVGLWLAYGAVALAVWITYARLPASDFYNVSGTGFGAGAARVLVLIGWPVSIAAVALMAVALDRLLAAPLDAGPRRLLIATAIAAVVLCATIAWPGVIDQANLDAKPVNGLAAVGVGLCVLLTVVALHRHGLGPSMPYTTGDRIAVAVLAVMGLAAIPWILANLGFYAGDVPGLGHVFMSKQVLPEPGHPHLRAVHLGNHEGLDGWLLAATALFLRRPLRQMRATRLRTVMSVYLAVVLAYGVLVAAGDGWNEQLVKRGWLHTGLPGVLSPKPDGGGLLLLACTAAVFMLAYRRRAVTS
jgi:hypothetical protein